MGEMLWTCSCGKDEDLYKAKFGAALLIMVVKKITSKNLCPPSGGFYSDDSIFPPEHVTVAGKGTHLIGDWHFRH